MRGVAGAARAGRACPHPNAGSGTRVSCAPGCSLWPFFAKSFVIVCVLLAAGLPGVLASMRVTQQACCTRGQVQRRDGTCACAFEPIVCGVYAHVVDQVSRVPGLRGGSVFGLGLSVSWSWPLVVLCVCGLLGLCRGVARYLPVLFVLTIFFGLRKTAQPPASVRLHPASTCHWLQSYTWKT